MTQIILWIVLGGIAGWIASAITESQRGVLGDIILGILGAVIGGWVMVLVGGQGVTGFNLSSLLVAILGSVLVIWISRSIRSGSNA
jgi:uncharacterized membrane protein YeaQ/YmgE (transglycosylase-associated protein family)